MTDTILVEDRYGTFKPVRERDYFGVSQGPAGVRANVESKSANFTVTARDSGKTFLVTAADKVATLPATDDGLQFTFVTAYAASGSVGLSVSPAAADKIMGTGITSADNKDLINTAATDYVGDFVTLTGDGDLGWYVTSIAGVWARE